MTPKILAGILLLHLATAFGVIAAGGETQACAGSSDFFCGTPLAGIFDRADALEVSANPFRFIGSVITFFSLVRGLVWYDYAVLNESGWTLVVLALFVIRLFLVVFTLYMLWRFLQVIAQTAGRFLTR